jgi:ribonuclease VapC
MVIDTSAPVAILLREPGWESFLRAIPKDGDRKMSTVSRLETNMVVENRKSYQGMAPDRLIRRLDIVTVPFDQAQLALSIDAFRRYGKGRHPARLNLGDCCAHSLAKSLDEPLLFQGAGFSLTDVRQAPKDR